MQCKLTSGRVIKCHCDKIPKGLVQNSDISDRLNVANSSSFSQELTAQTVVKRDLKIETEKEAIPAIYHLRLNDCRAVVMDPQE